LASLILSDDRIKYSESTLRRVQSTERVWDFFVRVHNPINQVSGLADIIALMYYRLATVIPGDPFVSSVKLQTFTGTELNLLVYA